MLNSIHAAMRLRGIKHTVAPSEDFGMVDHSIDFEAHGKLYEIQVGCCESGVNLNDLDVDGTMAFGPQRDTVKSVMKDVVDIVEGRRYWVEGKGWNLK